MSNSSKDSWFYTHGGGRHGPVALSELQRIAKSGNLNPRYDMCWTTGMAEWRPTGEIEGVFERVPRDERKPNAATRAKAATRQSGKTPSKRSETELERELMNADWPGVSRAGYLFATWILPFLLIAGIWLFSPIFLMMDELRNPELVQLFTAVGSLMLLIFFIIVSLQRLKNLGMTRWWFLAHMLPLVNLWVGYRSICCPAGYAYHSRLDGFGIFMAILYWGVIILVVASLVLATSVATGLVSNEMFDEFRRTLEVSFLGQSLPSPLPPESTP